jgi:hypothetical protein
VKLYVGTDKCVVLWTAAWTLDFLLYLFIFCGRNYTPMRPNSRGLAQRGGPPGWLEESEPAGVILYRRAVPPAFSVPG